MADGGPDIRVYRYKGRLTLGTRSALQKHTNGMEWNHRRLQAGLHGLARGRRIGRLSSVLIATFFNLIGQCRSDRSHHTDPHKLNDSSLGGKNSAHSSARLIAPLRIHPRSRRNRATYAPSSKLSRTDAGTRPAMPASCVPRHYWLSRHPLLCFLVQTNSPSAPPTIGRLTPS